MDVEVKTVNKNIADLRREPKFKSERLSQALFNTPCEVLSDKKEWALVKTPDGYQGWIEGRHLSAGATGGGPEWKVKSDFALVWTLTGELITRFAFDTRFHATEMGNELIFKMTQGVKAKVSRRYCKPTENEPKAKLIKLAKRFMGVPYLWGGISPFGFDCSGFVQTLFHYCGIQLPRHTEQQMRTGEKIGCLTELEPGDLAFFPGHVGLYLDAGLMIHANLHAHGVSITNLYADDNYSTYLRENFLEGRRLS